MPPRKKQPTIEAEIISEEAGIESVASAVASTKQILDDYAAQAEEAMSQAVGATQAFDLEACREAEEAYQVAQNAICEAVQGEMQNLQAMMQQVNQSQEQVAQTFQHQPASHLNQGAANQQANQNPDAAIIAALQGMSGIPGQ